MARPRIKISLIRHLSTLRGGMIFRNGIRARRWIFVTMITIIRCDLSARISKTIDNDSNFQKCHNGRKIRDDNRLKAVHKKTPFISGVTASVKHGQKKIRCSNKRNVEIYSLTFRIKGGRGSFKQICRWAGERGKTTSGLVLESCRVTRTLKNS